MVDKPQENQNQNQTTETQQIPSQETTQQTTQQTDGQASTNVAPDPNAPKYTEEQVQALHKLYGQALGEKQQELERQRNSVHLQPQNQQQVQQTQEQDQDLILTQPRKLIKEEINQSLAPINSFVQQFQYQQEYERNKQAFKNHPQFGIAFRVPNFEAYLDQAMQGVAPTVENITTRINYVYGTMQMNGLIPQAPISQVQPTQIQPQQQFQQPINTQPINTMPQNNMPAHLRPSAPAMPNGQQNNNLTPKGNVRYQLTELQERVRKENGMSADDYIDWISESSRNVVKSDIGKPQGGQ